MSKSDTSASRTPTGRPSGWRKFSSLLLNAVLIVIAFIGVSAFQARGMLSADRQMAPDLRARTLQDTYFDLDPTYSISSSTGLGQDAQQNYGLRVSYNHESGVYFTGTYEYVDLDQQPEISALRLIGGYKF